MVVQNRKGVPMSEEDLTEWLKTFSDIEESIALVYKNGVDL